MIDVDSLVQITTAIGSTGIAGAVIGYVRQRRREPNEAADRRARAAIDSAQADSITTASALTLVAPYQKEAANAEARRIQAVRVCRLAYVYIEIVLTLLRENNIAAPPMDPILRTEYDGRD